MNANYKGIIIDPGHGGIDLGYSENDKYEKDFNLQLSSYIYYRLKDLGFPVYLTRDGDYTISNYERNDYINQIIDEVQGKVFVLSIQIDDENENVIEIIYSINNDDSQNKDLYNSLNDITNVRTKTLPNDENKDYYMIQRIAPEEAEVIVFEFGYQNLNNDNTKIQEQAEQIVNVLLNQFNDQDFASYETYVVEKGDSLYSLSLRYETTIRELQKINNLGTDYLDIGQVLKVPKIKENFYIVKRGDSLYSIAKKFNTTVDKIKDINNLLTNKLSVNQKLLIPD